MRLLLASVLAPALILSGVSAVDAETKYHDSVPDTRQPTSSLEFNISVGSSDRDLMLAVPVEPSQELSKNHPTNRTVKEKKLPSRRKRLPRRTRT